MTVFDNKERSLDCKVTSEKLFASERVALMEAGHETDFFDFFRFEKVFADENKHTRTNVRIVEQKERNGVFCHSMKAIEEENVNGILHLTIWSFWALCNAT